MVPGLLGALRGNPFQFASLKPPGFWILSVSTRFCLLEPTLSVGYQCWFFPIISLRATGSERGVCLPGHYKVEFNQMLRRRGPPAYRVLVRLGRLLQIISRFSA